MVATGGKGILRPVGPTPTFTCRPFAAPVPCPGPASRVAAAPLPGCGMDPERLFVDHLPCIKGMIGALCRRHAYRGAVAEDFGSWATQRLMEDEYRILRKFQGRSKLTTYLTVVLGNLAIDYRVQREGRWRPCAAALRAGDVGVRLDTLANRDGFSHREAVSAVRSEFPDAPAESELFRMLADFPPRPRREFLGDEALSQVASPARADAGVVRSESDRVSANVLHALEVALAALETEDQVILRLRFEQGMTVADVARALGLEQRPLYRRLDGLLRSLRAKLVDQGVGEGEISALLGRPEGAPHPSISWGGATLPHQAPASEGGRREA